MSSNATSEERSNGCRRQISTCKFGEIAAPQREGRPLLWASRAASCYCRLFDTLILSHSYNTVHTTHSARPSRLSCVALPVSLSGIQAGRPLPATSLFSSRSCASACHAAEAMLAVGPVDRDPPRSPPMRRRSDGWRRVACCRRVVSSTRRWRQHRRTRAPPAGRRAHSQHHARA